MCLVVLIFDRMSFNYAPHYLCDRSSSRHGTFVQPVATLAILTFECNHAIDQCVVCRVCVIN